MCLALASVISLYFHSNPMESYYRFTEEKTRLRGGWQEAETRLKPARHSDTPVRPLPGLPCLVSVEVLHPFLIFYPSGSSFEPGQSNHVLFWGQSESQGWPRTRGTKMGRGHCAVTSEVNHKLAEGGGGWSERSR